jgi:Rad52/22 family double-strand break repair protein
MAHLMLTDARNYLSAEQVSLLLKPVHPQRVLVRDGMSYVEGYDIKAELNRVFGFARWSAEILDQALVCENETTTSRGKNAWYVVYRTSLRLTVCAPDGTSLCRYEESHVGESTHPVRGEAHGNALTNSWTYALKRCATSLGDQFGLSLYNKGSRDPIVRWTLVDPRATEADTDDVIAVNPEETESGAEEAAAPAVIRTRRAPAKPAVHSPAGDLENPLAGIASLITDASTVEELRGIYRKAQEMGVKASTWVLETGEAITVEQWLLRRHDEIAFPGGTERPEAAAGEDVAGQ